jgi:hypothetical protein
MIDHLAGKAMYATLLIELSMLTSYIDNVDDSTVGGAPRD